MSHIVGLCATQLSHLIGVDPHTLASQIGYSLLIKYRHCLKQFRWPFQKKQQQIFHHLTHFNIVFTLIMEKSSSSFLYCTSEKKYIMNWPRVGAENKNSQCNLSWKFNYMHVAAPLGHTYILSLQLRVVAHGGELQNY